MNRNIETKVKKIIEDVQKKGDSAITYYSKKYDNISLKPKDFQIKNSEIKNSEKNISKELKDSLIKSAKNIENFHKEELRRIKRTWKITRNGLTIGQIIKPVEKVGIYVAGGKYAYYPSIVLMTAIPAKVAGVKKIIMATPPSSADNPAVLFSAKLCGISEIYRLGGPQAVAGLAFGTETIPKVDLIIGPGSSYVTEAKRQLFGIVGIDLLAGPSELAVLCDQTVDPDFITYDLLAQAEHSPESKVWLFSNSEKIVNVVYQKIVENLKKSSIKFLENQFIFVKKSIKQCINELNNIAPEHLQIIVKNPEKILTKIKNAGAIFIGKFSPVALGDYFAGPSHVLPTGSTAKFSSGLSVQTFLKKTSVIKCERNKLFEISKYISKIAETEKLTYHKKSIEIRVTKGERFES